jgi:hypothetical protein
MNTSSSMLKVGNNNNMRYLDIEANNSSMMESSIRDSQKYKTPDKKIVLGKKKKKKRKTNERMFNNSYLNCYFQMHKGNQNKLEKTNMSFGGDSIKTKEENESMYSLNHDNIFNQPKKLPFWKKILQLLTFSDQNGMDRTEEDGEAPI